MEEFLRITSRENSLMKLICALQSSAKARRENGLFVLEGLRICMDALENGVRFEQLVISDGAAEKYPDEIVRLSGGAARRVRVSDGLFRRLGDTDSPQGILALAPFPAVPALPKQGGRYVGLEQIADPTNLGAVARTAEALGVAGIVLSGGCDPYAPKVLRASMGTLLRVPLFFAEDITAFARQAGLRTVACVVERTAPPISSVAFADGDLLLIGNEANGLTDKTRRESALAVTIPMCGRAESLNAAAAAAIGMWEMMRA